MENFTLVYPPPTGTVPIYQLSFSCGDEQIYKIILPQNELGQFLPFPYVPDETGANIYSINQYISTPQIKKGDGIYCFTMINLVLQGYGTLHLISYSKNDTLSTILRSFNLTTYSSIGYELQRYVNEVSESFRLLIQADQTNPAGLNGFFQINEIDIYANKLWSMRPALTETA